MTVLKAFRLPVAIAKRLSQIAKVTHRSEKFYVTQALEHYFEDYVDAQIAKDRFNEPSARMISGRQLREKLGV